MELDLGNLLPIHKGTYAGGTAYIIADIVDYGGSLYYCKLATTGNLPTDTTYWIKTSGGIPTGSIQMYGVVTAPIGWLLCDGTSYLRATYQDLFDTIGTTFGSVDGTHFNVPDTQGIFVRGAGSHENLTNANGAAFSGTLGTEQNDKFQGHKPELNACDETGAGGSGDRLSFGSAAISANQSTMFTGFAADGSNGTPRTGTETNPANISLTYVIKI